MAMICPNCGVYCRELREVIDENGDIVCRSTVCVYCKRPELTFKDDTKTKARRLGLTVVKADAT